MNVVVMDGWLEPIGVVVVDRERDYFVALSRYETVEGMSLGNGFFNGGRVRQAHEPLIRYVGREIEEDEMDTLLRRRDRAADYCLEFDSELTFLNCYQAYLAGDCLASYINSPASAREDRRQRSPEWLLAHPLGAVAEANAYLFADFELDAGGNVSYFIEVRALRGIMPGEEILARYCRVQDEQGGIYYRR